MHNRLGLLLVLGLITATAVSAQITITDTHEGGKPVPKPAPFNAKTATQAQNVSRLAPLRNRDIIQMVRSGAQPAAILSTLRSRRGSFDLSPQGCAALRGANVSQAILNAMGGSGGSQCTSSPAGPGGQHTANGTTLLGNRNTTLMGDGSVRQAPAAVAMPSNGGDPVALNPQPLPPRTGKTLLQNSAPKSGTPSGTRATKASTLNLQHAGTSSVGPTQTKSAKGAPGTSSASPQ